MVLIFPLKSIHIRVCIIIVILLSKKLLYQLYHITLQYNQYPKLYLFIFLPLHLNILFIIYLIFLKYSFYYLFNLSFIFFTLSLSLSLPPTSNHHPLQPKSQPNNHCCQTHHPLLLHHTKQPLKRPTIESLPPIPTQQPLKPTTNPNLATINPNLEITKTTTSK